MARFQIVHAPDVAGETGRSKRRLARRHPLADAFGLRAKENQT
jgi:hypothetical protein